MLACGRVFFAALPLLMSPSAPRPTWADTPTIQALAIDPTNSDTVYAGGACTGVAKSNDAGAHWTATNAGIERGEIRGLVVDPRRPGTIYASAPSPGPFKSTDGGASWRSANRGLPTGALAFAVNSEGILFAGTVLLGVQNGGGVYRSTDAGGLWTPASNGLSGKTVYALAVSPTDPRVVYAALAMEPAGAGGLFQSTDGGDLWRRLTAGLPSVNILAIAIDPEHPATAYVGTRGSGVFKTTTGGASWAPAAGTGGYVFALALDPTDPATVYAGTTEGMFKSTDRGATWQAASVGLSEPVVRAIAIDPITPVRLYVGVDGGKVFKSTDGAAHWTSTPLIGVPVCGDGVIDAFCDRIERCEDGNLLDGDGCDSNCTFTACGNGVTGPGEECDDGNGRSCDGCSAGCRIERGLVCGDGVVNTACGEQCDDQNRTDGDGCDSNCTFTACGNGVRTAGEECEDGNSFGGDGCSSTCRIEFCGDGIVQRPDEACDDGNASSCDGCSPTCQVEIGFRCRDTIVSSECGEECDDGNSYDGDGCESNCKRTECGDGIVSSGEECDDGNRDPFDGCTARCTRCGNGIVTPPEQCDDGHTTDADGCTSACTRCGDGTVTPPESCDDGNLVEGDGCPATCLVPGCGNGVREPGEDCDDGGWCAGSANAGVHCTGSSHCPGGECMTFGGDGCAANCTRERDLEVVLMPSPYVPRDIAPRTGGAVVRGDDLAVPVRLGGSLTLTVGRDRGDLLIPVAVKASQIQFPPDVISDHFRGCVRGVAARSCGGLAVDTEGPGADTECTFDTDACVGRAPCAYVHGPGNAATGLIDCRGGLVDGVDMHVTLDRATGVRDIHFSGTGGPGSARLRASLQATALGELTCSPYAPPESGVGKDGRCCTYDDQPNRFGFFDVLTHSLVTGTATGTVSGSDGVWDSPIGPVSVAGMPFDCRALTSASENIGPVGLVGAAVQAGEQWGGLLLTVQLFTRIPCAGDCNNDGTVTIDELLTLVGVALGRGQVERCLPGDHDRDGAITIDEIVTASAAALDNECGSATGARHER